MMFKQIPVTVCHNSGTVCIKKQSDARSINEKRAKSRKSALSASSIFFKFSQELDYMMFKQIPVTVCHNSGTVCIKKQSDGRSINEKRAKSRKSALSAIT